MLGCAIFLMFCVLTTRAALFQSHYLADTDLDDTVFYDTLLSAHHSDSLALCFAMCGQNCNCLGYNSQKKRCHLYKSCDSVTIADYETGWRYYNSKLEGKEYKQMKADERNQKKDFECERLGAYLVSIETEEENTWLTETFLPAWDSGANDIDQEGRFVWTGNNRGVTSYSNWHPDEPDNAWVGDCVHICRGGIWGDYNCDEATFSYICEKD
ncbi:CD209 antigen-like protein D [Saccostrea cucullata]|uniref:CD209 antigen-like protein D n=1 Tax=Saccostrea cuccullata TaxID=36930 RepID=UPI002ED5E829